MNSKTKSGSFRITCPSIIAMVVERQTPFVAYKFSDSREIPRGFYGITVW
jgi:hypothetical protein